MSLVRVAELLAYLCAALAAGGNALANVMQRKASLQEAPDRPFGPRLLLDLVHRPSWLLGFGGLVASFGMQALAPAKELRERGLTVRHQGSTGRVLPACPPTDLGLERPARGGRGGLIPWPGCAWSRVIGHRALGSAARWRWRLMRSRVRGWR